MTFSLNQLTIPVCGAPMAGGPSTPELVAAVSNAGGLGMLGAGHYDLATLKQQVGKVRELLNSGDGPFGVNLFVPQEPMNKERLAELDNYREKLQSLATRFGLNTVNNELHIPQHFEALVGWLQAHPVPVVTFTFGLPPEGTIQCLQAVGTSVGVTVTTAEDALVATNAGADFLCVQGPDAGGHQSTFTISAEPNTVPLPQLISQVQESTHLPLIAGGGVANREDFHAILGLGMQAVQIGTLLVQAQEAGTDQTHLDALNQPARTETRITRAFTGRPARAVVNDFVTEFDEVAPAVYPHIHYVTAPLRAAAKNANDARWINAWASTEYQRCTWTKNLPAAEIIRHLR